MSQSLRNYVWFYLIMTTWCIFVSIVSYTLHLRNRLWKIFQKTEEISPTLLAVFCVLFVHFRFTYETRLCLCDFREDFFLDREGWAWSNPDYDYRHSKGNSTSEGNYRCNSELDLWLFLMLVYEATITGLHFLSILYFYFTNVFKVSIRKQGE